jgi:hypothetical protein
MSGASGTSIRTWSCPSSVRRLSILLEAMRRSMVRGCTFNVAAAAAMVIHLSGMCRHSLTFCTRACPTRARERILAHRLLSDGCPAGLERFIGLSA